MTSQDFMDNSRQSVMSEGGRKNKKQKKQFLVSSSYNIKDLFVSGRVLFNTSLSDYVEQIRKKVTATEPQLESETKVFVIKSSVVNAFATNQGYVFITTGLLSQLENEAQLAFILCHELMHYKLKHVLKSYIENENIEHSQGGYRKSNIDKNILKATFSKEGETEADLQGFDLFVKTGYSIDAVNGTFDVLKYSELPFEDIEFKPATLLETEYLKFPVDYILEEIEVPEGANENEEDAYSSHPNLQKRRDDISDKINGLSKEEKSKLNKAFIVSEEQFYYNRKLARFDLCHTNLLNQNYDRALYEAYILLEENPNSIYLQKVILKALYGITKFKYVNRYDDITPKWKDVKGEAQRLNYLMETMQDVEANAVAINYAWRLKKKLDKPDVEVDRITEDLFSELVKRREDYTSFSDIPRDSTTTPRERNKSDVSSKKQELVSRTGNLRKKKKEALSDDFITYAFVDMLKDTAFVGLYERAAKAVHKKDAEEEQAEKKNKRTKLTKLKYNEDHDTYALNVDKLVIVNPFYLRIDERKESQILYKSSDNSQSNLITQINNMAGQADLQVDIIDKKQLTADAVTDYNEMAIMMDWIDERAELKDMQMIPTDYLRMEEISKKYGTDHVAIMGVINFIEKKTGVFGAIFGTIFIPVISWPITIPMLIKKETDTFVYTLVFNIKTGKPEMVKVSHTGISDYNEVTKSIIFDHLKQVKRKGKNR